MGEFAGSIWIKKYQITLSKHNWAQIAKSEIIDHTNTHHIETVALFASKLIK